MRNSSNGEFRTKWLQLGCYLHAAEKLPYLRTEHGPDGMSYFIFSDKDNLAPRLQLEFSQGARVSATALFGSLTFFRKEMQSAKQLGANSNVSQFPSR